MKFCPAYRFAKPHDYLIGRSGPTSFFDPLILRHLNKAFEAPESFLLKAQVYFVYPRGYRGLGSVFLRIEQMAAALRLVNPAMKITLVTHQKLFSMRLKKSIILLSKASLERLSAQQVNGFKGGGNYVVYDCIDGEFSPELEASADAFFCSSKTEYGYRAQSGQRAFLVPHAHDLRLFQSRVLPQEKVTTCVYIGNPREELHGDRLDSVEKIHLPAKFNRFANEMPWFKRASLSSFHYIARPSVVNGKRFKPPTKAIVAALSGALVISTAEDAEFVSWVGADYPYLAPSNSLPDVLAVIDFALGSVDAETVRGAHEAMRKLAREFRLEKILKAYCAAFADIQAGF